jgi:hypothetical protein
MVEHRHPALSVQKNVLSASGNQCAFPGCSRLIFDLKHETLIGTIAHIQARSEKGPRFDANQSEEQNRSFGNLIALCAEHSKVVDGTKWSDFSVATLLTWKIEHEAKVANDSDRNWIRIPNQIHRFGEGAERLQLAYWIDRYGRPRAFNRHQLSVLNVLMTINTRLLDLGALPGRLISARDADVATVLQQDWAKFPVETSVTIDLVKLLAMAGDITFAEFLSFMTTGVNSSSLVQEGAARIARLIQGENDPVVTSHFESDGFV